MDEIRMVRDVYSAPGTLTAAETNEARARLDALMKPPRWRRARWVVPCLGLGAVATALAVIVSTQPGGPRRGPEPGASPMPANQVLLTAAESSAHTPQPKSRTYWFTHFTSGEATLVPGHGRPYVVHQRLEQKDWTNAHSPHRTKAETRLGHGGSTTHYYADRDLGSRPEGAANIAAWRRDGKPSRWTVPDPGDSPFHLSTKAGRWAVHKDETSFESAFANGSLEQLRRLPTDPAQLLAYFQSHTSNDQQNKGDDETPDEWAFEAAEQMLMNEPVPAQVRVAAYRMLAGLPGVRTIGAVTDPLGRAGVAVEMRGESDPKMSERIIVEPSSGRLLARESFAVSAVEHYPAGTTIEWNAMVDTGWTDQPPRHAIADRA